MICATNMFKDPKSYSVAPQEYGFIIESEGETLQGYGLSPAGNGEKFPVALMLHGIPGTEQNRDLAQDLRRAGLFTVVFHYRGSWGSSGDYKLSHVYQDGLAVLKYIKDNADKYNLDTNRIYIIGHSLGCFAAMNMLSSGINPAGVVLIAPCNMEYKYLNENKDFEDLINSTKGILTVPDYSIFANECEEHKEWLFESIAEKINPTLPILAIGAANDECVNPNLHIVPTVELLKKRNADITYKVIDADHAFNAKRIELAETVIKWLEEKQ